MTSEHTTLLAAIWTFLDRKSRDVDTTNIAITLELGKSEYRFKMKAADLVTCVVRHKVAKQRGKAHADG